LGFEIQKQLHKLKKGITILTLSFFLRKDIAVLNCISKDCRCDDLADAAISADPRLKEWRSRFQSSSSSDTLPVNSKTAA
jgi:hypothetical protein